MQFLSTETEMINCVIFELEFSPDICPGMGLLDHTVILFLVFKGTFIPLFVVAASVYIPTNSVGRSKNTALKQNICRVNYLEKLCGKTCYDFRKIYLPPPLIPVSRLPKHLPA